MATTIGKPCNKIPFELFCRVCDDISNAKNEKKVIILEKFINKCRGSIEKNENINIEDTFYPALRLLLPSADKQRGPYGVKEVALAKLYVKILCLAKDSPDAQKLLNFKVPKIAGFVAGDFAETIYWVIRSRFEEDGAMTISDINQLLDEIALKHATHESREVEQTLQLMLLKFSANEQKWFIRLLLKDMHLGIAHTKILNTYHRDANELYDVCNDLMKVCKMLNNPSVVLHEISINLFEPFSPMLSQRCTITDVNKVIKSENSILFVDIKLDGERFQLHYDKNKNQFKYFSRRGNDYTDTYGCNDVHGVLSPVLAKQFKPDVKNCILDGEMMCYNTKYKSFSTKAKNIDVKKLRIGNTHQPCFCVFDIIYYNNNVLTSEPLEKRLKILNTVFDPLEGIFVHTTRQKAKKDDLIKHLENAIDNLEEGIVVKDPLSIYKPNSRYSGWYKIKPEYTDGAMIELDLLIIGGYYGEGKRRGDVSHFLLGLLDKDGESFKCTAISRVSSGFSTEELAELSRKLSPHWKRNYPGKMPPNIEWGKEKPDLWIEPESSIILQVKATEIMSSNTLKNKITLRFPRIERVRYDKPWHDGLTVDEFESIIKQTDGKLYTLGTMEPSSYSSKIKKARVTPIVGVQFQAPNLSNINCTNNLLENKEFCVLNDCETMSKSEIEKKIHEYGGQIVQNPGVDTFCVLSKNIKNVRAHAIKLSGKYSIIDINWIVSCFNENEFLNWAPENILFLSKEHQLLMDEKFDEYGDSYSELATVDSLCRVMDRIELDDDLVNSEVDTFLEFQKELFDQDQCFKIFEKYHAYFDDLNLENLPNMNFHLNNMLEMLVFKFNGGTVCTSIDWNTTHVVVHSSNQHNIHKYQIMNKDRKKVLEIVDENWIKQQIKW